MQKIRFFIILSIIIISTFYTNAGNKKKDIYPEKKTVLNYLALEETIEKFGKISDAIWSYAELGMQEFKSAGLLIKTLENDGRFNYVRAVGNSLPMVIKIGAAAVILGVLVWGVSTYVAITKTLDTLNNINNTNAGQIINEYK